MRDYSECQAYVEHLRSEHRRIHELLASVSRKLRATESPCSATQVRDGLNRLRDALVHHFQQEEDGGCLEEAACFDPRVSKQVGAVEEEHPKILRLLDRLLEHSSECAASSFRESFQEFAATLHAHEAAENRILHIAFGTGEFEPEESELHLGDL